MANARMLLAAAQPVSFRGRQVYVVDSPHRMALAIPGSEGRVLITSGLRRALHPCELEVAVAHERAHLDSGDHRHLMILQALEVAFGLSRRVGGSLRYALERAADETACGREQDRRHLAARALCRAAGVAPMTVPLLAPAATVAARVKALARPPVVPNVWAVRGSIMSVGGVVVGGVGSVGAWVGHAHQALTLAICTL